jgi:hypothetical protein
MMIIVEVAQKVHNKPRAEANKVPNHSYFLLEQVIITSLSSASEVTTTTTP